MVIPLIKAISFEEKKKFLEAKLSEEEIGEVMRRFNGTSTVTDSVLVNVKESPVAESRI